MALVFADRVRETTSTAGTGTFSLLGAVNSCQSFSAIGNGNTTYYTAVSQVGTEWEVGLGTYNAGTLTRDTILASSNGGSIVNFSAGTKDIFCDYPAGKAVLVDGSGNTYAPNIGGTTASAGTFTSANVNGTGQNLITYSNTLTNGVWILTNATVATTVATTDPLGGSAAYKLTDNVTNAQHGIAQPNYSLSQQYLTCSIYAKAAEYTKLQVDMSDLSTGDVYAIFDLSAGTAGAVSNGGSWTNGTAAITSVGNGWYRCSVSASKGGGGANVQPTYRLVNAALSTVFAGTGSSGLYLYGAQLEASNIVGAPVITTASTVFNPPNLKLAGNTVLNFDQYGNLSVSPSYPSGAIQAQAYTGTVAGGNIRGANAVDFQTLRAVATQVASGNYSVVAGGQRNTASTGAFVGAGYSNTNGAYEGVIVGGSSNSSNAFQIFIGGGSGNSANGSLSAIAGGSGNSANGIYNFIGGGYSNTGTAGGAVTTQSATMNGTTTVTLSGANAAIKIGQFVDGTYITYPRTYVANISGTTLTLSQAASGSGVATLSFYTPHGVVVGGGNNQATGAYSFIGGGGDAGTASNRNVASGDWSFVGGGRGSVASGYASVVVGGGSDTSASQLGSTASGVASSILGGLNNFAYGTGSSILGGYQHQATADMSTVVGGRYGATRSIVGYTVFPACNVPMGSLGASQAAILILARQTTDATATVLTSSSSAASANNQIILPNNSAYYFKGSVIANVTGAANGAAWSFEGAIMRGANAASTVLIGTPSVNRTGATAGAAAWIIALTADTTNGGLAVTVTGAAATTIRWVAKVETTEVTF